MAWTTPPTFAAAATLTAAQLNILSDDLNFLKGADRARAYASTTQSISTSSWTRVNLGSEDYDNNGIHSTASNTWKMLIATSGLYLCIGQVEFAADAGDTRRTTQIRLNDSSTNASAGTRLAASTTLSANTGAVNVEFTVATLTYLSAGDYVSLHAWHNVGSSLNINAGNDATWFAVAWIGD